MAGSATPAAPTGVIVAEDSFDPGHHLNHVNPILKRTFGGPSGHSLVGSSLIATGSDSSWFAGMAVKSITVCDDFPHKGHSKNKTSCSSSTGCLSNIFIVVEQTAHSLAPQWITTWVARWPGPLRSVQISLME
jgi:hypothetical protein